MVKILVIIIIVLLILIIPLTSYTAWSFAKWECAGDLASIKNIRESKADKIRLEQIEKALNQRIDELKVKLRVK
jgi:flagellar basal body-associated protein FliL